MTSMMFTFSTITPENPIEWVILSDSEDEYEEEEEVQDNESYDTQVEDLKAAVDQQKYFIEYAYKTSDNQNEQIDKLLDAANEDQSLLIQKDARIVELDEEIQQSTMSYEELDESYIYEKRCHEITLAEKEELERKNRTLEDEIVALKKMLNQAQLQPEKKKDENEISYVEYSEKAFAIFGDTRCYKDAFTAIHGRFNRNLKHPQNSDKIAPGWIFSKKHYNEVMDIIGF
jgi:hypothetical protein